MAFVWAKTFANLPVLSVFLLLLLCLPPGGGQKKKEVMLQSLKCIFQANIVVLFNESSVQVESAGVRLAGDV